MSEETDALRELAANRGCRLRTSRRRKPGGDFGRYGLIDAGTGRKLFGFGDDGLTATDDEIRAFLRGGAASGWKTSLGGEGVRKAAAPGRKTSRPKPAPKPKPKPKPEPEPEPEPKPLKIREAAPRDAQALAALISALGYEVDAVDIRRRIGALRKAGQPVLVAEADALVGVVTWHVTPVLHRPGPVGRITLLAVDEQQRGKGVGSALVDAVETRVAEAGCVMVEVTSNVKRLRAHQFYERLGYERTSYRFAKPLGR